ncbi:glycosyltransferase family 2 protein [Flavobacterium dauae]|uniref:glycosyltransferase family 2 protein n=1 Tax=Flavobacterium dauae TaxID=1563479 RepID=UPI00101B44BC|nr:glycosyltransferase family 2 protein [Flavobacterium dauae]WLD22744.1 glycosyltransferase family 2 protein [Flavobacterium dauae]
MSTKISALVITLNEAKNIRDLVNNLDFADEIIIVDSYSTDETLAILKEFSNIKVYQHTFQDFSSQRNIALKYAAHNWILFIDADERISENLRNEILKTVSLNETKQGYYFKRKFYFLDRPMGFSGLRTDKNLRLFKKEGAQYRGLVHEKLNIANTGTLQNYLTHYSYSSYGHFKDKVVYYNKLKALEKIKKGVKPSVFMSIFHPVYTFLNRYFFRLGILDGKKGYIISKIYAQAINERYKEMFRLMKEQAK